MCGLGPHKDDMALKNMYINPAGEIDEKTLAQNSYPSLNFISLLNKSFYFC